MKTWKKQKKRFLSCLVILSMLLSYVPPLPVRAASLTYTDTTENQSVFGFTYLENGRTNHMYLYQSDDGKWKLTGDILFTTGSYGYYQVRHYDGYLELLALEGIGVKQAILIQHGSLYTDEHHTKLSGPDCFMDLRILDEYGTLYSFNARGDEQLTQLEYGVTKIDDVFYLNEYDTLGAVAPKTHDQIDQYAAYHANSTGHGEDYYKSTVLEHDVEDFLVIGADQESSHSGPTPRDFNLTKNTQLYIKYTDNSQSTKRVTYDDGSQEYELVEGGLAIPSIDPTTNTLTIDNLSQSDYSWLEGIDATWVYVQESSTSDICLDKSTPTNTSSDSETYSVMDGHVTVTLIKTDPSTTGYDKLVVQSDSTETITFDSTTSKIETGYGAITLSGQFYSSGYVDAGNADALYEKPTSISSHNYAKSGPREMPNDISCEIYSETVDGTGYYDYNWSVRQLGDRSNGGNGFVFGRTAAYRRYDPPLEIGEGLTSIARPDTLEFTASVPSDPNHVYNHVLDFMANKHYIYKNHYKYAEYPMNFKVGETDNPYVYSEHDWELRVYAWHEDINGETWWWPRFEFSYAPTADTSGYDYPYVNIYGKTSQGISKPLTYDENTGLYERPNGSSDYNLFDRSDIQEIVIGDTHITGSSLLSAISSEFTPIYNMSGGKCVYRVAKSTNNKLTYDVMEDGTLYVGNSGHAFVADGVVKVDSDGNYLKSTGDLYNIQGEKIKENVINLTDNLYQTEDGTWKYLDTDEAFKFNYADDHNLLVHRTFNSGYTSVTYAFEYNEDEITSVTDEKGKPIANLGTRTYKSNGTHAITLTNKYGEEYTKSIIVTGFYGSASANKASVEALNGKITITGPEGTDLQYKKVADTDWTDYEEPFDYDGEFLFKASNTGSNLIMKASIDEVTGKLTVTDLSEAELTPNDYYVNAVWDGEKMRYYDATNNTFKLVDRGMSDGAITNLYTNYYAPSGGSYGPPPNMYNKVTLTAGPQQNANVHIKPQYGFIGPQLGLSHVVPVHGGNSTSNTYEVFRNENSNGTDMAYMGNFTIEGINPSGGYVGTHSENVFSGDTRIENVLDSNNMTAFYRYTTSQETSFVKAWMDGFYNWLVTDTGQLLRSKAESTTGAQNRMYYNGYILEEIANDVTSVDEDYLITTTSGKDYSVGFDTNSVKYYLASDIEANGGVDGAPESGDTIIASSNIGTATNPFGEKRALASNGNFYVALDDNTMVSYDHVTPAVNQLDYDISTTNWTNELVTTTPTQGTQCSSSLLAQYGGRWVLTKVDDDGNFCQGEPDEWGNPNLLFTTDAEFGTASSPLYNGKYRLDFCVNGGVIILTSQLVTIKNVDTVKPDVDVTSDDDGKFTFTGEDKEGVFETDDATLSAFNGSESAVSGIKNLYYSLDNTVDINAWSVLDKPVKYSPTGTDPDDSVLPISQKTIYVYAKDNAGNMSDVKAFNLGVTITPTLTYRNGETDLTFYADDDETHTNAAYSYSYTIGETTTDGYEKTFTTDTNAITRARYDVSTTEHVSTSLNVPVVVLKPSKPTISDIDAETRSVTVTAGTPAHMNFKELWVKVDDGEFTKYTTSEKVITFTDYGYHTIQAYQVAENTELAGGPYTFTGDTVEKAVEDPEPVTIHHSYAYEKGKTTVTFYANTDTNNDDPRWAYKYTVAGATQQDGYTFSVTEDTTADLFAEVDNGGLKTNNTKPINIYVMDAEKPQISDVPKNGNQSTITAGEIVNDTLKKLEYRLDNETDFTEIQSGDKVTIPAGWHDVYAKQTTDGGIVTENNRRVYVADLDITHKIKHHNGHTTLTFEDKDTTTNPDLTYTYDIEDDDPTETIGRGLDTNVPVTVNIKETDPQGNDDTDRVDLDIVKTEPPSVSVSNDTMTLTPGDIENGTLIHMYYSFDNQNFVPYDNPVPLELTDNTVYAYQTVIPDNPGGNDDIVQSDTTQKDIFKYDVKFVDNLGAEIGNGYSHVVLTGTSVTENAIDIPTYTPREASITKTIDNPGMVLSFVYDGNPVTVTIYHLDAENSNAELDKDVLAGTALDSEIKAADHKKSFTGYKFKNADPSVLNVTRDDKEMRIYYGYDTFDYVVHYVDADRNSLAGDKTGTAKFRDTVTENAINIANYTLDDETTKSITIKATEPNEIWFVYKKVNVEVPRSVTLTGRVTDDADEPIVGGKAKLKKKQGFIGGILEFLNLTDEDVSTTNADGWYLFTDLSAGVYDLSVEDNDGNQLAKAEIHVGKTGHTEDDAINVTDKANKVLTNQSIVGDRFELNVGHEIVPITVTVYHLDATNNNAELEKEEFENVAKGSTIRAIDKAKAFTGYQFKNATPDELTVSKTAKELKLYYEYAKFDYVVHYVDENQHQIAPNKTAKAEFRSEVTEQAIDIANYTLDDEAEKTITIKADEPNEIWFKYKVVPPEPGNANYTVRYVDEEQNLIAPNKTGSAQIDSDVTEQAINVEGYDLDDEAEKIITIKADEPNVITFKYKKHEEIVPPAPRQVIITGCIMDENEKLVLGGKATLDVKEPDNTKDLSTDAAPTEDVPADTQDTVDESTIDSRLDGAPNDDTNTDTDVDNNTAAIKPQTSEIGEDTCYMFTNVLAGLYEVKVYDVDGTLLASADINVSDDPSKDVITTTMTDKYATTQESIEDNVFVYNVKKLAVPKDIPTTPEIVPEIVPEPTEPDAPPLFSMYKEIVLKKKNTFTINLQGITKNAKVTSKITGKGKRAKKVIKIKQKKNGNVVVTPKKLGTSQVTCSILQNGEEYKVVVNIKVLKQYKGTSKNFNLKKNGLVETSGDLPEFNVYKRIVKGKKTKIKFTNVTTDAKVKFYVANKKEAKALKIGKIKRKGKTATCTIRGKKQGWVHLTAEITQNGKTYYTRLLVRIDDRSQTKEEISKQIHKYLQ